MGMWHGKCKLPIPLYQCALGTNSQTSESGKVRNWGEGKVGKSGWVGGRAGLGEVDLTNKHQSQCCVTCQGDKKRREVTYCLYDAALAFQQVLPDSSDGASLS